MLPVRALLEAHFLSTWNAARRNVGFTTTVFAIIMLLLTFLFFAGGAAVLGVVVGRTLAARVALGQVGLAGLAFTVLGAFGVFSSSLAGQARELEWERFRLYPVPGPALFIAETVAMLADPVMAVLALGQLALALGLISGELSLWPVALMTALAGMASLTALRLLFSTLLARLVSKLRIVGLLLAMSAPLGAGVVVRMLERGATQNLLGAWDALKGVLDQLPAARLLALHHHLRVPDVGAAVLDVTLPLALLAAIAFFAVRGVLTEPEVDEAPRSSRPERLWSFSSPAVGLARLQVATLLGSQMGRYMLFMPLLWLLPTVFSALTDGSGMPPVLGIMVFTLPTFMTSNLLYNQFGLDRGAVKALFLLPVADATVLDGKALGYAAYQVMQWVILGPIALLLVRPPLWQVAAGLTGSALIFMVLLLVGQWSSVYWARPIQRRGFRQAQGSMVQALVVLGTMAGLMAVFGGAYFLWVPEQPWAMPLALGILAVLVAVAQRLSLTQVARVLSARRERLVEVLS